MKRKIGASRKRASAAEKTARETAFDALLGSTLTSMEEIAQKLPLGRDIADRLRTDPGAQSAWKTLLQQNVPADAIADDLRMRLAEDGVSLQQLVCVALFAHVVIEFSLP